MHTLYEIKCAEDDKLPLKEHMYRKVFDCEFNLAFHVPRTDRCDVCEEKKVAEKMVLNYLRRSKPLMQNM